MRGSYAGIFVTLFTVAAVEELYIQQWLNKPMSIPLKIKRFLHTIFDVTK